VIVIPIRPTVATVRVNIIDIKVIILNIFIDPFMILQNLSIVLTGQFLFGWSIRFSLPGGYPSGQEEKVYL
jgi:hypothetical protein